MRIRKVSNILERTKKLRILKEIYKDYIEMLINTEYAAKLTADKIKQKLQLQFTTLK